jgi:hypothetical protein
MNGVLYIRSNVPTAALASTEPIPERGEAIERRGRQHRAVYNRGPDVRDAAAIV